MKTTENYRDQVATHPNSPKWNGITSELNNPCYYELFRAFREACEKNIDDNSVDHDKLRLVANACSLHLRPDSLNEPYIPYFIGPDSRSASLDDFTDEDSQFFADHHGDFDNLKVGGRLADIVWLTRRPREPQYAIAAIDAYRALPIDRDTWFDETRNCWQRAIRLSLQLGKGANNRLQSIADELISTLLTSTSDKTTMGLEIADLLFNYGLASGRQTDIAEQLESISENLARTTQDHLAREYLDEAAKWYHRLGDEEKHADVTARCAELWAASAEARTQADNASHMLAAHEFEQAIQKYRRVPTRLRESRGIVQRISELRAQLNLSGQLSLGEMGEIKTDPIDITEIVRQSETLVDNDNLFEALARLSEIWQIKSLDARRSDAKDSLRRHPLRAIFSSTHMSRDGRVVGKGPGISFDQNVTDDDLMPEMIRQFSYEVGLAVQACIWPALETITNRHLLREVQLVQLAHQSPIVPVGRERLVGKALYHGYNRDFASALHLATPQIEHLVRHYLKLAGAETIHLNQLGIETENGLSTLITHDKAEEVLGADLRFEIEALLCSSFGPNLRNEVAHGLVEAENCESVYGIYVWWLLFRLVYSAYWNAHRKEEPKNENNSGLNDA